MQLSWLVDNCYWLLKLTFSATLADGMIPNVQSDNLVGPGRLFWAGPGDVASPLSPVIL
jgi:hypothetical protein